MALLIAPGQWMKTARKKSGRNHRRLVIAASCFEGAERRVLATCTSAGPMPKSLRPVPVAPSVTVALFASRWPIPQGFGARAVRMPAFSRISLRGAYMRALRLERGLDEAQKQISYFRGLLREHAGSHGRRVQSPATPTSTVLTPKQPPAFRSTTHRFNKIALASQLGIRVLHTLAPAETSKNFNMCRCHSVNHPRRVQKMCCRCAVWRSRNR